MPSSRTIIAFIVALAMTIIMGWGIVYFTRKGWSDLPPVVALILFILLAFAVIGYPIVALARHQRTAVRKQKSEK